MHSGSKSLSSKVFSTMDALQYLISKIPPGPLAAEVVTNAVAPKNSTLDVSKEQVDQERDLSSEVFRPEIPSLIGRVIDEASC